MDDERIRILLVDDDQGDYVFVRALLNRIDPERYALDWVPSFGEAVATFERADHDLLLVDYLLEDRDGLELLRIAKEKGVSAPVIVLTGRGNRTLDVEAMRAGAADYLVKGELEPDVLERTIRYALEGRRSIRKLQERAERLRRVVEGVPVALYRVRSDGSEPETNPAMRSLLGGTEEDEPGGSLAASLFVAPEDRDRFLERLRSERVVRDFRTRLTRPDGAPLPVVHRARMREGVEDDEWVIEGAMLPVEGAGSPPDAVGTTEGARLRTLLGALDRGVAFLHPDGRIRDANASLLEFLGRPKNDLVGRRFAELHESEDRAAVDAVVRSIGAGELDHRGGERRLLDHRGEPRAARISLYLVREPESGAPESILAVVIPSP